MDKTLEKEFDEKYDYSSYEPLSEDYLKEIKRQSLESDKFRAKITSGNKHQETFFDIIDNYIKELSDNEKLEGVQNIIKYCKRRSIEMQKERIK